MLSSFLPRTAVNEVAAGWARRDGECVKQVEGLLDQTGLTMEHVIAETLADWIDDIERIDRMIASAEQRRGAILAKRNTPKRQRRTNGLRAHPKTHPLTPP